MAFPNPFVLQEGCFKAYSTLFRSIQPCERIKKPVKAYEGLREKGKRRFLGLSTSVVNPSGKTRYFKACESLRKAMGDGLAWVEILEFIKPHCFTGMAQRSDPPATESR